MNTKDRETVYKILQHLTSTNAVGKGSAHPIIVGLYNFAGDPQRGEDNILVKVAQPCVPEL